MHSLHSNQNSLTILFLLMTLSASHRLVVAFISRASSTSRLAATSLWLSSSATKMSTTTASAPRVGNPLLEDWSNIPYNLPPFSKIKTEHFEPALEEGMKRHLQDLQDIVDNPDPPTFENVIAAYDRSGGLFDRVSGVYGNMCNSLNTEELQEVQTKMSPILSRHSSKAMTLPGLFDKIQAVFDQRSKLVNDLSPEQCRLIERIHMDFTRAGANFDEDSKKEYAEIKAKLASLMTQFMQNMMKDESTYELLLKREELQGCPESLIEAAKQAAIERNHVGEDDYVITLSRSLVEPFLIYADDRELRRKAFEAWTSRGQLAEDRNNIPIAQEILNLRLRQAQLHGYKNFAEYQCVDRMAKTPEAVMKLLEDVWTRAKVVANKEREAMEEYLRDKGFTLEGGIQPWDWRYVAEKVRKERYDFDQSSLKPYLSLESVRDAMFSVSTRLFGLDYIPKDSNDVSSYHPDVVTYEVRKRDTNELVSLFLHDNFSRPFKSSGAWMSEYRSQTKNLPSNVDSIEGIPIVSNNNNFAKGEKATFLSHDDALTMFHEFGHAHHGMLSDATYGRLASTNVLRDFVELPSQLMEHWFNQREVLNEYARHHETGEPIPGELLDRLEAAKTFNQGFDTIEYTICALLDMAMHRLENYDNFDIEEFERTELGRLGMPAGIVMRHRPAHFAHLFATNGYAAGYYVYLWAETLDADVFAAFTEKGDIFDPETADKARKYIYSAGNTVAPEVLFRNFRGREPDISFMLKKKGLL